MSNVADVTIHDSQSDVATEFAAATQRAATSAAANVAAGAVVATAALAVGAIVCAQFLFREDERQKSAERARRQAEHDAYARRNDRRPAAIALRVAPDELLASARTLGFRPVDAPQVDRSGSRTPRPFLLQNAAGERLTLQPYRGGVVAATAGDLTSLHRVARQHTLLATTRHLSQASGQPVRMRTLPGGSVQLQATERDRGQAGGPATLTVEVATHGNARVDISRVRGNRCEQILADYARAIGGEARVVRFKPECTDPVRPGETARVRG